MGSDSVDLDAVRKQVEYYFSDSNLPRDKFLRAKTEEDKEGYVDISVLTTFKRMQALGASVSNVVVALNGSELLSVSPDAQRVRRTTPLPEKELFNTRAVFAKGWTPDGPEPKLEELVSLFSPSGSVLAIRIRRWVDDNGKHFKGSIFVEMENPEAAERVVAEEYTIKVMEDGEEVDKQLYLQTFSEYIDTKKAENSLRKKVSKKYRVRDHGKEDDQKREHNVKQEDGNAENDGSTENGLNVENGVKTENSIKTENGIKSEDVVNDSGAANDAQVVKQEDVVKQEAKDVKPKREVKPGLILKFTGFGTEVSREDIREVFEEHGHVDWVDFNRGQTDGYIRFSKEGEAETARKAMQESKMEFGGQVPVFSVLEGEVEQEYWHNMWKRKDEAFSANKKRRRENGHRGRGGKRFRGGGGGRRDFNRGPPRR